MQRQAHQASLQVKESMQHRAFLSWLDALAKSSLCIPTSGIAQPLVLQGSRQ
jgi:hypothetical protein